MSAVSLALPSREMCVPATALALSLRPPTVLVRPLRSAGHRYELGVHGDLIWRPEGWTNGGHRRAKLAAGASKLAIGAATASGRLAGHRCRPHDPQKAMAKPPARPASCFVSPPLRAPQQPTELHMLPCSHRCFGAAACESADLQSILPKPDTGAFAARPAFSLAPCPATTPLARCGGHCSRGAVPRAQVGCSGAARASGRVRDRRKHQHDQDPPARRSRRCARRTPLPAHRTTQASVLTRLAARRCAHPCSPSCCPCPTR